MTISPARARLLYPGAVLCLVVASAVAQVAQDARAPVPARYDYDEGVYAATVDAYAHGARLYRDVFLSQPPVLVLMIRGMFALLGPSLSAARATVVLSSVLWLIAILMILHARGLQWGGPLAVCLVLGRGTFLVMARTVEMEVPSEALACAAIALAAWGTRRRGQTWWVGAGALAGLAVMTKLTAATCLLPLAMLAITERGPALVRRWAAIAAGAMLAAGTLLPLIETAGFTEQVFAFHVALARARPEPALMHAAAIGLFLAAEWPLSVAAIAGLVCSIRRGGWEAHAPIVWLAADCGVLIGLTPLWDHHLIILISPLALLAGAGLDHLGAWIARLPRNPRVAASVGLAAAAACYLGLGASTVPRPVSSGELQQAIAKIAAAVPANGRILTDDPMVAFLARRSVAAGLADTSLARIWVGEITEGNLMPVLREPGTDAVVFWRGTFREYFPRLEQATASLFPVAELGQGRRLLRFKAMPPIHRP